MKVRYLRRTTKEIDAATNFYESRDGSVALDFVEAVDGAIRLVLEHPNVGRSVCGNIRRVGVVGFPYLLYYRAERDEISFLSLFHTSRRAERWQANRNLSLNNPPAF